MEERKIKKLFEWISYISSLRDTESILFALADASRDLLNADRCSIFIYDKKEDKLWTMVAHGVERIAIEKDKGLAGYVFTTGEPIIIDDAYKSTLFNPEVDKKTGYKTRNILAYPLISRAYGKTVGVFEAMNKLDGNFDGEDLEVCDILCANSANIIENILLLEELKKTQIETVLRLSIAAEFRDPDTYNHLIRMSNYSYILAREMGLPEDWCEKLKIASPMHDIGKLGVPDRILLKPGKLTPEEYEEMKKHTIYGFRILEGSDIDILKIAANIARYHHEKYDGSGYPDGLKGEDIPLEARIVSVADVFDALTSKRVYKDSWPLQKVLEYMEEQSGRHFDPNIIKALKKALPKLLEIMERYKDE